MHFISSLFHYTQAQYLVFTYKLVVSIAFVASAAFVAQYTSYAPWWKDSIGKRIVYETIAIMLLLMPLILSLFFNLSRLTSEFIAWYDVSMLAVVAGIVIWGIVVWKKEQDFVRASIGVSDDSNEEFFETTEETHTYKSQKQGQIYSESESSRKVSTSRSNSSAERPERIANPEEEGAVR